MPVTMTELRQNRTDVFHLIPKDKIKKAVSDMKPRARAGERF